MTVISFSNDSMFNGEIMSINNLYVPGVFGAFRGEASSLVLPDNPRGV
jgi:hypothetical protein